MSTLFGWRFLSDFYFARPAFNVVLPVHHGVLCALRAGDQLFFFEQVDALQLSFCVAVGTDKLDCWYSAFQFVLPEKDFRGRSFFSPGFDLNSPHH